MTALAPGRGRGRSAKRGRGGGCQRGTYEFPPAGRGKPRRRTRYGFIPTHCPRPYRGEGAKRSAMGGVGRRPDMVCSSGTDARAAGCSTGFAGHAPASIWPGSRPFLSLPPCFWRFRVRGRRSAPGTRSAFPAATFQQPACELVQFVMDPSSNYI